MQGHRECAELWHTGILPEISFVGDLSSVYFKQQQFFAWLASEQKL